MVDRETLKADYRFAKLYENLVWDSSNSYSRGSWYSSIKNEVSAIKWEGEQLPVTCKEVKEDEFPSFFSIDTVDTFLEGYDGSH